MNAGVYGAELAYWLAMELAKAGVVTSYPNAEDWGWFLDYAPSPSSEFVVHCGNIGGARDHWLLSLRRFGRKEFGRDKPSFSEAARLIEGIKAVIARTPGIVDVKWLDNSEVD